MSKQAVIVSDAPLSSARPAPFLLSRLFSLHLFIMTSSPCRHASPLSPCKQKEGGERREAGGEGVWDGE